VVGRSGLDVPDVASVSGNVAALESVDNSHAVADGTTGSVDDPGALLHLGDGLSVDEAASALVQRAVDGQDIDRGEELVESLDAASLDLGSGLCVGVSKGYECARAAIEFPIRGTSPSELGKST